MKCFLCFLTFCGSYINLYIHNINPDTLVYFLTSSVENFIPHPLQLKFSPTFSGAPSRVFNDLQYSQLKFPRTFCGAPLRDVNDLQLKQLKSQPTFRGAPSKDFKSSHN